MSLESDAESRRKGVKPSSLVGATPLDLGGPAAHAAFPPRKEQPGATVAATPGGGLDARVPDYEPDFAVADYKSGLVPAPEAKAAGPDAEIRREEIKASLDAEYKDAEHYDKWLLTLSSGAFGISIAFMRYIAPDPTRLSKGFLVAAWVSLLLAILATMSSMQFSQSGFRRQRKEMRQDNTTNRPAFCAKILNWTSLSLFIIGAAMLAVFSFLNLGG